MIIINKIKMFIAKHIAFMKIFTDVFYARKYNRTQVEHEFQNMENIIKKMNSFIELYHSEHMYSIDIKYVKHLQDTYNILIKFGFTDVIILLSGLGHDLLEMTEVSYNDLKKRFGIEVAEIVYLVTDEKGRNRKERHEKTYPELAKNEKAVIVKLADRIANVEAGLSSKDGKVDMYRSEYKYFKDTLFNSSHDEKTLQMWKYLDQLLK